MSELLEDPPRIKIKYFSNIPYFPLNRNYQPGKYLTMFIVQYNTATWRRHTYIIWFGSLTLQRPLEVLHLLLQLTDSLPAQSGEEAEMKETLSDSERGSSQAQTNHDTCLFSVSSLPWVFSASLSWTCRVAILSCSYSSCCTRNILFSCWSLKNFSLDDYESHY